MAENGSETRRMIAAVAISVALVAFVLFRVNLDFRFLVALLLALVSGGLVLLLLMQRLVPAAFVEVEETPASASVPEAPASTPAPATPDEPKAVLDRQGDTRPAGLPAPRGGVADDLKKIKGIGPKLEEMLNGLGIYHFDQIAGFSDAELAWIDDNLQGFKGRATRDDWVSQARALVQ